MRKKVKKTVLKFTKIFVFLLIFGFGINSFLLINNIKNISYADDLAVGTVCTSTSVCAGDAVCGFKDDIDASKGVQTCVLPNEENNSFGSALCGMFKFVTGKVGRGAACGAIIWVGVEFFLGKISWGAVTAVALGVGAIFGAPAVVKLLTGKGMSCIK